MMRAADYFALPNLTGMTQRNFFLLMILCNAHFLPALEPELEIAEKDMLSRKCPGLYSYMQNTQPIWIIWRRASSEALFYFK